MQLALGIVLCGGIGFALVSLCWSLEANPGSYLLRTFLAIGYGLGAFSVLFILQRVLGGETLWAIDALALALLLIALFLMRRRAGVPTAIPSAHLDLPLWLSRLLGGAFVLAAGAGLYCAVRRAIAYPHGEGWDAFAIWNLHARFIFRGGTAWRDGFSPLIPWSHPDYPLLIPAAIAHFWTYLGHDSQAVPSIIGLMFTISTAGVLFSALLILRGRNVAMLGCMALLATPAFVEQGTSQYADVPLSFFLLAAVVLVCLHDASPSGGPGLMVLAGVACSFAAWTKNEGLLFLFALVVARFLVATRGQRLARTIGGSQGTSLALLALAAMPLTLLIMWFKRFIAPPGDLFGSEASMLHKLLSDSRYGAILQWFGKQFLRFGHWLWIPGTLLVTGLYLALRGSGEIDDAPTEHSRDGRLGIGPAGGAMALGITLAGYFFIYVITPYDVYWHLRFSLNRLFLQLWPAAIFLCFLTLGGSRKSAAP